MTIRAETSDLPPRGVPPSTRVHRLHGRPRRLQPARAGLQPRLCPSQRQRVRQGQAHTNGIESFWALLKRGYYGTYHRMSPKHLQRYVDEFAGRHNMRPLDTIDQMKAMVRGMDRKRLRYRDLVG